jgi:predicted AAA+ superfamily ATPase
MKRNILQKLQEWRIKSERKPLLLRGVRQCGKTYILKEFGQTFSDTHYINFEKNQDIHTIFSPNLDPKRIINELSFYLDKKISIENDLLIFDEIQTCAQALTSLKYFQEDLPQMALCAAGSLLGLHLSEGSFPVGKVDMLHMFPMSFTEFLIAIEDEKSLHFIETSIETSLPEIVHQHLWNQFKNYLIVGGMPEIVQFFAANKKQNIVEVFDAIRQQQGTLLSAYYSDIAKHAGKVNAMHIDRILSSVPAQLARSQDQSAKKFQFKNIVPGIDRYQRLADAIDWLESAELIIKVPIVHSAELPLSAYVKENIFKLYLFDVGFLGAMSGLSPKTIWDYQYGTYKGYYAENFVAQSLLARGENKLFSWEDARAEVEFLIVKQDTVLPIEVKSGSVTKSQSLRKLVEKYHLPKRVILSGRNVSINSERSVYHYPLYLAERFMKK